MSKEKSVSKKDPKRFELHVPTSPIKEPLVTEPRLTNAEICKTIKDMANDRIRQLCKKKQFEQTAGNCATGGGATAPVDLVVVIDTSGSMSDEAKDLSAAADAAIKAAAGSCPSDLRVEWFGIEGTWKSQDPATKFTQTYRKYLNGLGVPDSDIVGTPSDLEDGAAAVMDLSDHFDWRPGAARAIFYLGDEALEGGDPQNADDVTAANSAIATANNRGVTVFTYLGTPLSTPDPVTAAEYARLANSTGGQAFAAPAANLGGFQKVLEKIICASGGKTCRAVEEPKIVPCLRLRWGDGPKDQIETYDVEVLCITVCNPYSNVTLKNFTLHLIVTDAHGAQVPPLTDGKPSVLIKPDLMICFGDIPPCNPDKPDRPSCISREVVLMSAGAIEGKYHIFVVYCFDACFTNMHKGRVFELELVKS
jgi:hypothetical protein